MRLSWPRCRFVTHLRRGRVVPACLRWRLRPRFLRTRRCCWANIALWSRLLRRSFLSNLRRRRPIVRTCLFRRVLRSVRLLRPRVRCIRAWLVRLRVYRRLWPVLRLIRTTTLRLIWMRRRRARHVTRRASTVVWNWTVHVRSVRAVAGEILRPARTIVTAIHLVVLGRTGPGSICSRTVPWIARVPRIPRIVGSGRGNSGSAIRRGVVAIVCRGHRASSVSGSIPESGR